MAEDSMAADEDLAGTDCLPIGGWLIAIGMAEDSMAVDEDNAGTVCLTAAGDETAKCIPVTAWMHPSDCKGIADTIDCTASGCIMADVGVTGAEHVFTVTVWEQ